MKQQPSSAQAIRTIYRTPEFDEFYQGLPDKVKIKFEYVFHVVQSVYNVSTKFVKHLERTDLYEMRVSVVTNEYRTILFAVDHGNVIESTKILLFRVKPKTRCGAFARHKYRCNPLTCRDMPKACPYKLLKALSY